MPAAAGTGAPSPGRLWQRAPSRAGGGRQTVKKPLIQGFDAHGGRGEPGKNRYAAPPMGFQPPKFK